MPKGYCEECKTDQELASTGLLVPHGPDQFAVCAGSLRFPGIRPEGQYQVRRPITPEDRQPQMEPHYKFCPTCGVRNPNYEL